MDWNKIAAEAIAGLKLIAPILETVSPASGPALSIIEKIGQGVIANEPTAVALINQIKSGVEPTPDQLRAAMDDYESAYQELKADIAAKLANKPV